MTGAEVRSLRDRLGLHANEFAYLLGVHYTTLCRWERGSLVRSEPLQMALLLYIRVIVRSRPAEAVSGLGRALQEALVTGGTLKGLAVLLADLIPPPPPTAGTGT